MASRRVFCDQDFHWYYLSRDRYRGWNEPSKTILANARHMPLHPMSPPLKKIGTDQWVFEGVPNKARRLSYKEAAALQDLGGWEFPDTVGLLSKYKVIGNARAANDLPANFSKHYRKRFSHERH